MGTHLHSRIGYKGLPQRSLKLLDAYGCKKTHDLARAQKLKMYCDRKSDAADVRAKLKVMSKPTALYLYENYGRLPG